MENITNSFIYRLDIVYCRLILGEDLNKILEIVG
jgi:hypothetical protein